MRRQIPQLDCVQCESREFGIFCELTEIASRELNQKKITNQYKKGQIIFYEGNQPFGLYCLYSGTVKLYKTGTDGRPQILRIASAGGVIGYRSLLANEIYHATAEVIEEADICFIDKNIFFSILEKNPQLASRLIQKLSQELRQAEELATSLAQCSARERMAELLLSLKKNYGRTTNHGTEIKLELSREEMAGMIGVTPETAIRLLSEFKQDGFIQIQDRKITILRGEKLLQSIH